MTGAGAGFRVVGTRTLVDEAFLAVERMHLLGPDGRAFERVRVRHPGAVAVVPVDGDDVWLIEQYRAPLERAILEIPAGKLDLPGDDPELAAHRELEEEVGMRTPTLTRLSVIATSAGFSDERIVLYRTGPLEPVPSRPHGIEETTARIVRMSFAEAVAMARSGALEDAKTVVGLLQAAALR
ncbi:MAG TPA: NUDIX hydrolase [Actinobacteria bacterium]|nr:NUDIX hydrolase [Actinomycetota bacterium]